MLTALLIHGVIVEIVHKMFTNYDVGRQALKMADSKEEFVLQS